MGSCVPDCEWLFRFSFSIDHPTRGGRSNGGKSIDNGLDDKGGDVFIHPLDCGSGDKRQLVVDEGGVNGVHIGASGDKDDEVANNGNGWFVERAKKYIDENIYPLRYLHRKAVRAGVCGGVDNNDEVGWFLATAKETYLFFVTK